MSQMNLDDFLERQQAVTVGTAGIDAVLHDGMGGTCPVRIMTDPVRREVFFLGASATAPDGASDVGRGPLSAADASPKSSGRNGSGKSNGHVAEPEVISNSASLMSRMGQASGRGRTATAGRTTDTTASSVFGAAPPVSFFAVPFEDITDCVVAAPSEARALDGASIPAVGAAEPPLPSCPDAPLASTLFRRSRRTRASSSSWLGELSLGRSANGRSVFDGSPRSAQGGGDGPTFLSFGCTTHGPLLPDVPATRRSSDSLATKTSGQQRSGQSPPRDVSQRDGMSSTLSHSGSSETFSRFAVSDVRCEVTDRDAAEQFRIALGVLVNATAPALPPAPAASALPVPPSPVPEMIGPVPAQAQRGSISGMARPPPPDLSAGNRCHALSLTQSITTASSIAARRPYVRPHVPSSEELRGPTGTGHHGAQPSSPLPLLTLHAVDDSTPDDDGHYDPYTSLLPETPSGPSNDMTPTRRSVGFHRPSDDASARRPAATAGPGQRLSVSHHSCPDCVAMRRTLEDVVASQAAVADRMALLERAVMQLVAAQRSPQPQAMRAGASASVSGDDHMSHPRADEADTQPPMSESVIPVGSWLRSDPSGRSQELRLATARSLMIPGSVDASAAQTIGSQSPPPARRNTDQNIELPDSHSLLSDEASAVRAPSPAAVISPIATRPATSAHSYPADGPSAPFVVDDPLGPAALRPGTVGLGEHRPAGRRGRVSSAEAHAEATAPITGGALTIPTDVVQGELEMPRVAPSSGEGQRQRRPGPGNVFDEGDGMGGPSGRGPFPVAAQPEHMAMYHDIHGTSDDSEDDEADT